jgi:hypothetical protein
MPQADFRVGNADPPSSELRSIHQVCKVQAHVFGTESSLHDGWISRETDRMFPCLRMT